MSPEQAVSLAERILGLTHEAAALLERVVSAVEQGRPDQAAYNARLAALTECTEGQA